MIPIMFKYLSKVGKYLLPAMVPMVKKNCFLNFLLTVSFFFLFLNTFCFKQILF